MRRLSLPNSFSSPSLSHTEHAQTRKHEKQNKKWNPILPDTSEIINTKASKQAAKDEILTVIKQLPNERKSDCEWKMCTDLDTFSRFTRGRSIEFEENN